jgi:sugar phosphate isomerase/epimerase
MNFSTNRRKFLKQTGLAGLGILTLPSFVSSPGKKAVGVQLYSVRKEMLEDPRGTLRQIAKIGFTELESARSDKGNYYGLKPKEIKKIAGDLGMKVVSGHVHVDDEWSHSVDEAAEVGQEYLICSSMPTEGQTVSNYEKVAETFSKAAEDCKKVNLKFGYHNHDYEFEKDGDKVLYDVLLEKTDPSLVNMELDLGWVIVTGNDPVKYFEKYPGRFPLWHLKDMDVAKKHSVEFGKGQINVSRMLNNAGKSGMKHFFVEQEEYASTAIESLTEDFRYLEKHQ